MVSSTRSATIPLSASLRRSRSLPHIKMPSKTAAFEIEEKALSSLRNSTLLFFRAFSDIFPVRFLIFYICDGAAIPLPSRGGVRGGVCNIYNISQSSPLYNKELMHYPTAKANAAEHKEYRKTLRNNMTPAEAILWRALKGRGTGGLKFRRQQGIGPFILDFYCPEHRLGIEIDGESHNNKFESDEKRTAYLRGQGIIILRFSNQQVFSCLR